MTIARFSLLAGTMVWTISAANATELRCGGQAAQQGPDRSVEALVDSVVTGAMERSNIPGVAVAVVRGGVTILAKGYGYADVEQRVAVTPRTIFRIGSITKVFTTLGIMQLADQDLVDLNDDVNRHLGQFQVERLFDEPVRIWHLLTHTAGFDQLLLAREGARESDRFSLATFLNGNLVRVRPPGKVGSYDTYGITLAGHLIEQISELPYDQYVERNVFAPLQMVRSSVGVPPDSLRRQVAVGYRSIGDSLVAQPWEFYRSTPASSINSTAADMAHFMTAILNEGRFNGTDLWSPETGHRIQQPQFSNYPGFPGFSFGFWDEVRNGYRAIFHGGNMLGFESHMYLMPEQELGLFVVYNREGRPFPKLKDLLTSAVINHFVPPKESAGQDIADAAMQTEARAADLAGVYTDMVYCHTCFEGEGGRMRAFPVQAAQDGILEFWGARWQVVGAGEFREVDGPRHAAFGQDAEGRTRYLFVGNIAYERLGDPLLDEALGAARHQNGHYHPFEARVYRLTGQWNRAIQAYESVLNRRPYDGQLHFYLGMSLLNAGLHRRAIVALRRAQDVKQWLPQTEFYLASAHAVIGNADNAFAWLTRAIDDGFGNAVQLEHDPNLESLRSDPRFADLIERAKQLGMQHMMHDD